MNKSVRMEKSKAVQYQLSPKLLQIVLYMEEVATIESWLDKVMRKTIDLNSALLIVPADYHTV